MELTWILAGVTLLFFLVFIISYKRNKASIGTGFWLNAFVGSALLAFVYFAFLAENPVLYVFMFILGVVFIVVALFGVYAAIALLFWNARIVFKKEKRSLANSLTLILGIALVIFLIASSILANVVLPWWVTCLQAGVMLVIIFYFLHLYLFLSTALLCNFARPKKRQDYVVVLGSGLVKGKITPLLTSRIDKAIAFYRAQGEKRAPPKLVFSGGQGADEPIAEAEAMARYALEKGIKEEDIILEKESANTWENMKFSKKVMEEDAQDKPYQNIIATSNYHLLRASIYARRAGIGATGIGSKTALYYLPNALLREYAAFLRMHLKRYVILAVVLFLGAAAVNAFPYLLPYFVR